MVLWDSRTCGVCLLGSRRLGCKGCKDASIARTRQKGIELRAFKWLQNPWAFFVDGSETLTVLQRRSFRCWNKPSAFVLAGVCEILLSFGSWNHDAGLNVLVPRSSDLRQGDSLSKSYMVDSNPEQLRGSKPVHSHLRT